MRRLLSAVTIAAIVVCAGFLGEFLGRRVAVVNLHDHSPAIQQAMIFITEVLSFLAAGMFCGLLTTRHDFIGMTVAVLTALALVALSMAFALSEGNLVVARLVVSLVSVAGVALGVVITNGAPKTHGAF